MARILAWWKERKERGKHYRCRRCGFKIRKDEASLSGWNGDLHVHCPRCGHVVARYLKKEDAHGA